MEPYEFYILAAQGIPEMNPFHYELEILRPRLETLRQHGIPARLSMRALKEGIEKPLINWAQTIPNLTEASRVFKIWSVGAAAKMQYPSFDINQVLVRQCTMDSNVYFDYMRCHYQTFVVL